MGHRNCPSFEIIFFPFSRVEPFGYNNAPRDGLSHFCAKFGAISPSPPKIGGRVESNHGI